MKNLYGGEINNQELQKYFQRLVNKIFKLLPMFEEDCPTLDKYYRLLMLELCSGSELVLCDELFLELIFNLQALSNLTEKEVYRSQVLKCTNLCDSISKKLGDIV